MTFRFWQPNTALLIFAALIMGGAVAGVGKSVYDAVLYFTGW